MSGLSQLEMSGLSQLEMSGLSQLEMSGSGLPEAHAVDAQSGGARP